MDTHKLNLVGLTRYNDREGQLSFILHRLSGLGTQTHQSMEQEISNIEGLESIAWKWMRYSGLLLIPLAWGHVLIQDFLLGVHSIDLNYVGLRWDGESMISCCSLSPLLTASTGCDRCSMITSAGTAPARNPPGCCLGSGWSCL